MNKEFLSWKVSPSQKGTRLLSFLNEMINDKTISNKLIKKAIDQGAVLINGTVECFSSRVLKEGDQASIWKNWQEACEREDFDLPILYEDPDLWIVNKPSGLEVLQEKFAVFFSEPIYLVHRLDKGTSGVMIIAKSDTTASLFKDLFATKKVKKKYITIVDGKVQKPQGHIENKLSKKSSFQGQTLWQVSSGKGFLAATHWSLVKTKNNISLLLCIPFTGRTHQIRVHLSSIGHPILGDYLYCKKFSYNKTYIPRLMLHSHSISFTHPVSHKKIAVTSPMPDVFEDLIGTVNDEKALH